MRIRRRTPIILAAAVSALLLGLATLGGCGPKRVLSRPPAGAPGPSGPAGPSLPAPDEGPTSGAAIADIALSQLGQPYRWGGDRPQRGFDCSGLVRWSYGRAGVDLPRVVREQSRVGRSIGPRNLHPGDLVFFRTHSDRVSHVGIYVGGGRFVHAPSSGQPVRTDSLDDPYWRSCWVDARRILDP